MLDPIPELREDILRNVLRTLRDEEDPDAFERTSRTICSICSRNAGLAPSKSQWASSKKNTSLGFSRSPTSGSDA